MSNASDTATDNATRIRFTEAVDGFGVGDELDTDPGVADAYVNWRQAAVYVSAKSMDRPPANKAMSRGDVRINRK